MNFMKSHAAAWTSADVVSVMYHAAPPICVWPPAESPGNSAAPISSPLTSCAVWLAPSSSVSRFPPRNASTDVADDDDSMSIDACRLATARYWSIWPGVWGMALRSPSACMPLNHVNSSVASGLSVKVPAVVSPSPRPLSLSTIVACAPVSQNSVFHDANSCTTRFVDDPGSLDLLGVLAHLVERGRRLVRIEPGRRK